MNWSFFGLFRRVTEWWCNFAAGKKGFAAATDEPTAMAADGHMKSCGPPRSSSA
jgi:hypothetical protein